MSKWATGTHGTLIAEIASSAVKLAKGFQWRISLDSEDFWVVNFRLRKLSKENVWNTSIFKFSLRDAQHYKGTVADLAREKVTEMVRLMTEEHEEPLIRNDNRHGDGSCCNKEIRGMNGWCMSCGDPCF